MDDEIMRYRDKLIRQAQNLPIWERKCLTVDEAAEYSGIGRKKLRSLLKKKNCPFALGHKDISTTLNIYTDVTKELKRSEFEGLDLYFKAE